MEAKVSQNAPSQITPTHKVTPSSFLTPTEKVQHSSTPVLHSQSVPSAAVLTSYGTSYGVPYVAPAATGKVEVSFLTNPVNVTPPVGDRRSKAKEEHGTQDA